VKDPGTIILIVLTIALLLAVLWVVINVSRIVFCILRDAWRAKRHPRREMQHPEFGPLVFERELWSGEVQRDGRSIAFLIAGNDSGPEVRSAERLREVIRRFPEYERTALEFIRSEEPSLAHDQFFFGGLALAFENTPENFAMEFTLPDDLDGCWRVEFHGDRPAFLGRDD
jgi:hypothetical protein